jgi:hypothetical protein
MRIAAERDTVRSFPAAGALKPMPEAQIAQAVQLLDLMNIAPGIRSLADRACPNTSSASPA